MESGNGGASSKGSLVPVSQYSDVFQTDILPPLKSAYLYEESKQCFTYKSAVLLKNPALEEKYSAFRAKRREEGYSEEDLKESFAFLLFDDVNKANELGETGVLTGNSTCTTLGDPSNGVYISMYSDCLDLNRWYHGKSGYIAIIRLTKGRVKKVLENYTQNFTMPTAGFDCHVSDQLPSVSAKTSSFLAFERTQYYVYELLDDGSNLTTQSPSAACPFAIVSFSYTDTEAKLEAPQEKSEEKKLVFHYFPWRGQLQIGTQFFDVGLRSASGALIPAELPPVVKIDRAITMLDLRQLLPSAVFETCFSGEVFIDGLYFSLCVLVSSEREGTHSLSILLQEVKEKDLALTIQLNDGGFLILLHSSNFLTYDDTASSATDVLQGMFVFPDSQVIQRDTKFGQRKRAMSSEILQVLPVLSYAEGEVEKAPIDPGEELCDVLAHHMQSYTALINPGLATSPSRELSIFPDQYDVPVAHKHLYSSPEWTNGAWQSFRSYLNKPISFQLPVSKASEILAAGQEEQIEDLDEDVYICLSSPEEAPKPFSVDSEQQLTDQRSPVNGETLEDSCTPSAEGQFDLKAVPENVVPDDLRAGVSTKSTGKSDLTVVNETDDMKATNVLTPSTPDDLPAELIVSITSAERTVTDKSFSATKPNDFQVSVFSTATLQKAGVNSLNDETVVDFPEVTNLTKSKRKKLHWRHSKGQKKVSKACVEIPTLQIPVEDDNLKSQKEEQAKEPSGHLQSSNPSNIDQTKVQRRKRKFKKSSPKMEKVRSASGELAVPMEKKIHPGMQSVESSVVMDLEACPLRRKTERWALKPVISECGRVLVPHGSVDFTDQIKSLKHDLESTKDEQCPQKMSDTSVNAHDTVEMEQERSPTPDTAVGEKASKDRGNHLLNVVVGNLNPEHSILRLPEDVNGSLILKNAHYSLDSKTDGTATPPSKTIKEKETDTLAPGKIATKGELLLSKLKSVLLRGKRKSDLLVSEEITADTVLGTESCLKKDKVDSQTAILKRNYAITSVQDTNVHVKEVSKMLSVDPIFAFALGLTPKETPNKIQKTEGQGNQQGNYLSETKEQTILDKQTKIIQRPPSIFPRRGRIKMLKKHQDISTENVKKKWWLHFQSPACFASEKRKYKACSRDNSVRKTVKGKMNNACSSTDALNLLADLALSASKDQVPPQPDPALERKPEPSLKKGDLTKDLTSAEQASVLHALLRQPAVRAMLPLESPSPSHLVGSSELVGLVSEEHAYSLPPSSSLLLGLPGTPFQVSPLSGSTRLLHHHQTMYANGIETLHRSVGLEDKPGRQNPWTPEYLKKCRRKFRHSRTLVNKDESIQVTKQWKENYDFNLDSKFTSDPKDRTIIRALHGPWDFSMQDTSEEVQLIIHMWIGLFYSRSTSRFFHVDSNLCSEESDSLEMSGGIASAPAQSELKADSFAPVPSIADTADPLISKAFDLSKKDDSALDQGSLILDLSLRKSNAEIVTKDPQVNRKETSVSSDWKEDGEALNTLKPSVGLQEDVTVECIKKMLHTTEIINEVNDVGRAYENKKTFIPSQKAGSLEHTDVDSCKDDGTIVLAQEEMENVSAQPEHYQTASGIEHALHEYNNEKTDMKGGIENSAATEMSLVQRHGKDSSKYVTDEEVDSNKEAGDVVHTVEHDEIESKDGENWQVKEKSYQQGNVEPSPDVFHTNENSTNEESGVVCNGNLSENEKQLSREESKSVSPGKAEYVNEDVDCCTVHKEAGDVAHAVEHNQIESKDGENWQVKEKSYQQGNVESSPDVFHTNEDSTNEESGVVCNGNLSVNEKQLSREESKSVSPGKAEYVDDDLDCCTVHKEAGDVVHTVEHDQIESKDGENWQVKEKPYQQGNVEPSPDVFHTNEDSTNEDSGVVCNVNLSKNEKRLSREESKSVSPGKAEDVDCCTVHKAEDYFGKEDGLDEKDSCVSHMEADSDLNNQPMSMMCDGPDSVKKDCISESDPNPPLDEQPSQADNIEDACRDLQLRKPCENGSAFTCEDLILEELPHALSETEPISNEPMFEKGSENDIFLDTTLYRKTTLPMSDEKKCSLDGSCTDGSNSPDGDETESQNKVIATINLSSDDHYDRDTKSTEGEQTVDSTTEKELFDHRSDSSLCKAEVALTKDTDPKWIPTNKGFEKSHSEVVIPFIGIYSSGEETVQPHDSHSDGKVEEVVQGQQEIPFSETTSPETILPTGARSSSQMYSQNAELSTGKISLSFIDVSETNQPIVSESTSDQRCSTPTMDEKPYDCLTFSDPGSTSAYALSMSEQSTVDANPHHDRHPECELSIDKFLSKSSHTNTISQIETADIKQTLDQTPNPRSKCIATSLAPSHTSFHFEDKKMNNTTPAVQSASTSQELHTESTGHFLLSAFSKLEEVLDAKLKLQKTDSSGQHYFERTDQSQETPPGQDYCHPHRIGPSTESLQAIKLNISQDIHKTTSPTNLSHETRPCSQRPVMAVKPSKSDDSSSKADYMSEDGQIQNDVMSHFPENKLTKTPVVTYTLPTTMLLEKKAESLESTSDGLNDEKQEAIELSSKSSWLSNLSDSKSQNISKKIPSSSLAVQSFESKKHYSKLVDGTKGVTCSVLEKVGQTAKENIKMNHKACSDASTSHADHEDGGLLMCTVYNTSRKRSYSFLEQVSHRCIQDDPTEASMEQECLIFSEQMKQLLKRSRKGPIRQQDTQDRLNLPGASPVTVHFSNLEEQEDSVDDLKAYLDAPLLGQKIKVDMSDRKDLWEEEKTLHPQKCSQGTGKHMNHAGVHSVTSECARQYKAMMNDVCAVKKVPSRPKHLRMDSGHPKTEPSNHFDRCDQMKRKMDESLGGNLKSVVKKSCRTKYRFYILVTSDDAFFERTKAQLEAEGHTAVQPSEFFLAEDSSSSLLIILRNEDIAEHICEVPHLLELKKSSAVQFAGIDEPDDVVNLTHQELFTRGGCIMLDSAALEPLSLCNMKKMSEILQELSRMGKWKWMLHYRDSRRLKENARLSAEAKEKKHFLNFCQDAGILDVLPYHECDLMSKDLPDYLTCLVRLQVQNISARYTVFITDTTADSSFGKNGILTMTFDSFLTCSPSKTFTA